MNGYPWTLAEMILVPLGLLALVAIIFWRRHTATSWLAAPTTCVASSGPRRMEAARGQSTAARTGPGSVLLVRQSVIEPEGSPGAELGS